jgi:hypothetical protein
MLAANSMKQDTHQEPGRERALSLGKVLGFHQAKQLNARGGRELLDEDRA